MTMRLIWSSLLTTGLLLIAMNLFEARQQGDGLPPPSFPEDGTGFPPPDPTPTPTPK
jgi:hypothetical protein